MPELISRPVADWSIEVKCKGQMGCKHTYRYFEGDVYTDVFKIRGYWFDGSAVTERKFIVHCGNCQRLLDIPTPPARVQRTARENDW